jgi:hypothetical protein
MKRRFRHNCVMYVEPAARTVVASSDTRSRKPSARTPTSEAGDARGGEVPGLVAPGYVADIVAVEGDPLADIEVTISKVRWVMKAGSVVVDKTGNSPVH